MIWTYTLTKLNELQARDADSLSELQRLAKEANWLWIDCMEPDDKELKVIAGLLKETEFISAIRKRQIFSHHEKVNDCARAHTLERNKCADVVEGGTVYAW
jgi:Mg2+ and Co2+ transporter CorA